MITILSLASSPIATGLTNLINDVTTMLMVLGPIACISAGIYFTIRRGMADEADGKMWTKRITTAIVCGVFCLLVGALIHLLIGYFPSASA
ncbi:MAG: hypothetical protein RRZ73_06515 [Oscillospiraceae bacterium]